MLNCIITCYLFNVRIIYPWTINFPHIDGNLRIHLHLIPRIQFGFQLNALYEGVFPVDVGVGMIQALEEDQEEFGE